MIDVSYRVIADHLRCLTFALTDGAMPSNEGRGYVLRRILRRAVRYGRQYLNMHEPFLADLVSPFVEHMSGAFPELRIGPNPQSKRDNVQHVVEIIRDEEESFGRTFDRGLKLYSEAADYARTHHHGRISGEAAFKLHDTFGFTIDLTELMAEEDGLTIDIGEYERLMDEARVKARGVTVAAHPDWVAMVRVHGPTNFVGYSELNTHDAFVEGVYSGDNFAGALRMLESESGALVLSKTPFYAEQGGQIGDRGSICCNEEGWTFQVSDTRRVDRTIIHVGRCVRGTIRQRNTPDGFFATPGTAADYPGWTQGVHHMPAPSELTVERDYRIPTTQNHTSTHIMNWALREVLGDHVQQKGSLVDPEKTRFDFSHKKPLSDDELARIEDLCNEQIASDLTVYTEEVDQEVARKINTLRAVFGEKYPDRVRVVSIGAPITEDDAKRACESAPTEVGGSPTVDKSEYLLGNPTDPKWMKYSVEFCGGTHLKQSSEAGRFVLIAEEGVAKGVRRLVGISGGAATRAVELGDALLGEATALVGRQPVTRGTTLVGQQPVAPGTEPVGKRSVALSGEPPTSVGADSAGSTTSESPRGLKSAARNDEGHTEQSRDREGAVENAKVAPQDLASSVAGVQRKMQDAVIPIRTRRRILGVLEELQTAVKKQQKQQAAASGDAVMDCVKELFASAETLDGVTVVAGEVPSSGADALRGAIDWVRNKTDACAVFLATADGKKVTLIAGMSKVVVGKGVKAGDLIKEVAPLVGGRGGGRPDMAQGGGNDPSNIAAAVATASEWMKKRLA